MQFRIIVHGRMGMHLARRLPQKGAYQFVAYNKTPAKNEAPCSHLGPQSFCVNSGEALADRVQKGLMGH